MVFWLCMRWWYGDGWRWAVQRAIVQRVRWCSESFSIGPLTRTLFAPFKQTYSKGGGSIDIRIHAFLDNVVSRAVGLVCRLAIIGVGLVAGLLALITGAVFVILWPLAPLSLPIGVGMMIVGVGR